MFGIGTKKARLHVNSFTNLLGEDENGWGLSHKGLIWHSGVAMSYIKRFKENEATRIGILFDGILGTLTYYKDGVCLGVAFRGLNEVFQLLLLFFGNVRIQIRFFLDSRATVSHSLFNCCQD